MDTFRVWHKKNSDFWTTATELDCSEFEVVAFVKCESYGEVFRLTNHIEDEWWNNPEVIECVKRTRSTSVGDIVQNMSNGDVWAVDKVGWKKISIMTVESAARKILAKHERNIKCSDCGHDYNVMRGVEFCPNCYNVPKDGYSRLS